MATTDTAIIELPLDQLHDSPTNPRQEYSEEYLQELGRNIREVGRVLQPLLVRPRVPALFAGHDDPNAIAGYEIVFGHRRRRGAEYAGLATAPCMVRAMTDEEVLIAQLSENLQRKDVHPIEEARGFRALLNTSQLTADDLAEKFGKSRSYIYSRLKLLDAVPEVLNACVAGKVGVEVTLLIARLQHPKLQQKALSLIKGKYISLEDGGKQSFRSIQAMLNEKFTTSLKSAPFDIEDEGLLLSAGHCMRCPKRSGNAPEFEDVTTGKKEHSYSSQNYGADVCTDIDCFAAKKAADLKRKADALRTKGTEVIDGNRARNVIDARGQVKGAYISLADTKAQLAAARTAAQRDPKIVPPQVVTIQDPRSGKTVQAVKVSELAAAGVEVKPADQRQADSWEAREARRRAEQAKKEESARQAANLNLELLRQVRLAMAQVPRDAFDLTLAVQAALAGVGHHDKQMLATLWGCERFTDLEARVGGYSVADLTQLMMDCALVDNACPTPWSLDDKPERLMAAVKHYGVSLSAVIAAPAASPSTPSTAARGSEVATKPGKPGSSKKAAPTPSTAARAAKGAAAGKPAGSKKAAPVAVACEPDAGGLFGQSEQMDDAGSAGEDQRDDAGAAVGQTVTAEETSAC